MPNTKPTNRKKKKRKKDLNEGDAVEYVKLTITTIIPFLFLECSFFLFFLKTKIYYSLLFFFF